LLIPAREIIIGVGLFKKYIYIFYKNDKKYISI